MSNWEEAMWAELDALAPVDRIVATGTWITQMTHELLTELSRRRRLAVVEVLAQEDWDTIKLAETIGAPVGTVRRLAEEGRALARAQAKVDEDPGLPVD